MIQRARASDVAQIAALYHAVWHETQAPFMPAAECARRDLGFFIERMSRLLLSTLIEERGGAVVAFSAWHGRLLGQIFVAAPHRGSGLAVALMSATETAMMESGVSEGELHCVVGNDRARRFYERTGWSHERTIMEQVAGENGPAEVPFWCMTKVLIF
jgi:GNAT superfamily N-acetyltransferase